MARNVNLRPEQTRSEPAIRLLTPNEPLLELLEPFVMDGYYHVETTAGEVGYLWSCSVQVTVAPPEGSLAALEKPKRGFDSARDRPDITRGTVCRPKN